MRQIERTYAVAVETPMYRTHWVWARNVREARAKIVALTRNELDESEIIASIGEGEGGETVVNVMRDPYFGPANSIRTSPDSRITDEEKNDGR